MSSYHAGRDAHPRAAAVHRIPRTTKDCARTTKDSVGDYMMRACGFGLIICMAGLAGLRVVVQAAQTAPPGQPAQQQAPQQAQQPIRVQVNLVNLFVTVRDKKSKRIVSDLEKGDFK